MLRSSFADRRGRGWKCSAEETGYQEERDKEEGEEIEYLSGGRNAQSNLSGMPRENTSI